VPDTATITISLKIENIYELYDDETTYVEDKVIDAPPTLEAGTEAYEDWAYDTIYSFTGVGHEDGNSSYFVEVTACSEPALVGREFEFGT